MDLSSQDRAMVRLYMAGCFHYWPLLPDLARSYYGEGASVAQLRGCVRHLVVFAGYGPCLAATLALNKAKLLPEDTPGKVGVAPGNAFELVYGGVTDRVRANMQAADPVLQEWIRLHLYGDVYSSPGLDLRQKQLLTCAFLAEAEMPDQLFGHALAGLRFGNSIAALEEVARLACEMGPRTEGGKEATLKVALSTLGLAYAKYCKDMAGSEPTCPQVELAEGSVRLPPLPPLVNGPPPGQPQQEEGCRGSEQPPEPGAEEAAAPAPVQQAAAADASVSVSSGGSGPLKRASVAQPGGWGTSALGRPTSMAVDLIAARMEEHRARSGLFYDNWEALPEEEGLPGADGYSGGGSMYGQGGSLEEQAAYEAAAEQADEEAATEARGLS